MKGAVLYGPGDIRFEGRETPAIPGRVSDEIAAHIVAARDAHSRYLLRCHIRPKADGAHVSAVFDAAFASTACRW